ncbi:hypothetical protein MWN34_16130 [Ancylobacter sp. 6x-1]|uniref:Uncharacterized protein n=1 Tax=Ancylobacter crimeensis TaxID=2579147 RepID=A0ABT0DER1_9HYPH|nr:hypothetical protein [Ancylobacter crimeensis]MCK0198442.1 hypothetical protein [Ancylobacter crimeensis]
MMRLGTIDDMKRACAGARPEVRRRLPTTIGFAAVPDHVRMPARFFGRFTACAVAGLR